MITGEMAIQLLFMQLFSVLVYIAPVVAVLAFLVKPNFARAIFAAITIAPFAYYFAKPLYNDAVLAKERSEIANIELTTPTRFPPAFVTEGWALGKSETKYLLALPQVDTIYKMATRSNAPPNEYEIFRLGQNGEVLRKEYSGPLPHEYFLLKIGRRSSFYSKSRAGSGPIGGPYELRLVDEASSDLVAIWYQSLFRIYEFPPVLYPNGFKTDGTPYFGEPNTLIQKFVESALDPDAPAYKLPPPTRR